MKCKASLKGFEETKEEEVEGSKFFESREGIGDVSIMYRMWGERLICWQLSLYDRYSFVYITSYSLGLESTHHRHQHRVKRLERRR